jgi:hypothetical protein
MKKIICLTMTLMVLMAGLAFAGARDLQKRIQNGNNNFRGLATFNNPLNNKYGDAITEKSLVAWSSPQTILNDEGSSGELSEPHIVVDSNGGLHVFYYWIGPNSIRYINNKTGDWSAPQTVVTDTGYIGHSWDISIDKNGVLYVIYTWWNGSCNELRYVYSNTDNWVISGTVTGDVQVGVTITLSGNASETTTTDDPGNYSFTGLSNGTYTVTPSLSGYTFSPSSKSVTISGANQTANFTATAVTYSISGTVTYNGSGLSDVTMTLTGSGSGTTTTDTSGNYTFSGLSNGSYTITPSLSGYYFNPLSRNVTISGANVTGQNFVALLGYAIIVSGQGKVIIDKWGFDHAANNAYRALRNLGFDDEHIFYLNSNSPQDVDGDGYDEVDAPALLSYFRNAINEVKAKIGDNPIPFILYLTGHGDEAGFLFDPGCKCVGGELGCECHLSALGQLKEMLNEFSNRTPMLIVIGSCYSGYFITSSSGSISAPNRIIITATHDNQERYAAGLGWIRGSDQFWGDVIKGFNVKDAFIRRTLPGDNTYLWLDDNGDLIGHPPYNLGDDGKLAAETKIGIPNTENLELTPWLCAWIQSPGELRVYDSQNRVTGLINGEVKEEIPNSIYDEPNESVVVDFPSDTYRYVVVGADEATYGLDAASIKNGEAVTFAATDIPTIPLEIHQYTIDWDAISQGGEGVTIEIDSEGDGIFEQTIVTSPPNSPNNPLPVHQTTDVSFDTDLAWNGGDPDVDEMVTYKVYFGASEIPPLISTIGPVSATHTTLTFDLETLEYGITYYWKIQAIDSNGITIEGPIWVFTTEIKHCSTWDDVIIKYQAYVNDQASWNDVISCYGQYVS